MDESEFRSLAKWQISLSPGHFEDRIQYLLNAGRTDSSSRFLLERQFLGF